VFDENPCASCCVRFDAAVTVTVEPDCLAHAEAAAFTAFVSAVPDEPKRIVRCAGGRLDAPELPDAAELAGLDASLLIDSLDDAGPDPLLIDSLEDAALLAAELAAAELDAAEVAELAGADVVADPPELLLLHAAVTSISAVAAASPTAAGR
jgi:hypothetical protein